MLKGSLTVGQKIIRLKSIVKKLINFVLNPVGYSIVLSKETKDFYLHKYSSYDEYARVQIHWNKVKIKKVFADKNTLKRVKDILLNEFGEEKKINGICHGTRNGYEQNYLRGLSDNFNVIGTDISETAKDYDNSIQWDFHDINPAWNENQDFIYTNSLDQSW